MLRQHLTACIERTGLPHHEAVGRAQRFIDEYLRLRNGLIVPAGEGTFQPPHRSFQEFLAARHLAVNRIRSFTSEAPGLVRQNYDLWQEVFLLAVGQAGLNNAVDAIDRLCPLALPQTADGWRQLCLAGRALKEVGLLTVRSDEKGPVLEERVKRLLYHTMRDTDDHDAPHDPPYIPIRTRADAGEVLDELGWLPEDLNAWEHVPGGQVYLHGTKRTETVPDFWMARYPVTNAQYERFIEAGGYDNLAYWSEPTGARKWWEGTKRRRPHYWDDSRFGCSRRGYPVVGVTWHETLAYCAWLNELLERVRAGQDVPDAELVADLVDTPTQEIILPSEAEWVRAAGGEGDDDRYPWHPPAYVPSPPTPSPKVGRGGKGERAEILARANVEESGLDHTTPVAMYPAGAVFPSGREDSIMDLAGNVWEWTRDMDKDGWVWLRGGSWYWEAESARVGSRHCGLPELHLLDLLRPRQRVSGVRPVALLQQLTPDNWPSDI